MVEEQKDETEEEIEVIDVLMNDAEIDEAIAHLMELKEHKTNVQFPLASDLDLSVTYSDDEEDSDEEDVDNEEDVKVNAGEKNVGANVNAENKIGEELSHE